MRQWNLHWNLEPEPTHGPPSYHLSECMGIVLGSPLPTFCSPGSCPVSPPVPPPWPLPHSTMLVGRVLHFSYCPSLPSEAWTGVLGRVIFTSVCPVVSRESARGWSSCPGLAAPQNIWRGQALLAYLIQVPSVSQLGIAILGSHPVKHGSDSGY